MRRVWCITYCFTIIAFGLQGLEVANGRRLQDRIVHGSLASPGQFPWQAAIHVYKYNGESLCGGALIHADWILTAAHCVERVIRFKIRLGALRIDGQEATQVVMTTNDSIAHEDYDAYYQHNDIALIRLPRTAPINDDIQLIALPNPDNMDNPIAGENVTISGWGKSSNAHTESQLSFANLQVISNKKCRQYFSGNLITDQTVCAKGPARRSPCEGDSGGGLVAVDAETDGFVHVGIASFVSGKGCDLGIPAAFLRTVHYLDWIQKHTSPLEDTH